MKHHLLIFILFSLLLGGCQSFPPPSPGMSSVRIQVVAEPKAGYVAPDSSDYGSPGEPAAIAFQRIDYSALDGIIVSLEPLTHAALQSVGPLNLDVADVNSTHPNPHAGSVNQELILHNIGTKPATFYSVSDGNEFDLGSIPPGSRKSCTIRSPGLIEILTDSSLEPVASVYAVSSPYVAAAHSGTEVDFTNVPPGPYKIISWHPRLPGYETPINLPANQVVSATIKVGVNALPKIGRR